VRLNVSKNAPPVEVMSDAPLSAAEIEALFAPLSSYSHLLLAVSGGPDSMALMGLVAHWARHHTDAPIISVATVDHGFRAEARDEVQFVARIAASLGLTCHQLRREGPVPETGLQEMAREARYALLDECAQAIGADGIVTAHHADDQAETIVMRLCHGSGPAGLAGMRAKAERKGAILLRPFLSVPHGRLVASLAALDLPSLEDPSNADRRFERVRIRQLATSLEALGLSRTRLLALGRRAARADEALDHAAEAAWQRHVLSSEAGLVFGPALLAEPLELVIRVLGKALARLGSGRAVRYERLEDLAEALSAAGAGQEPLGRTLGGMVIQRDQNGLIRLFTEGPRRNLG
jgi:tRNA(Ile)-lysidine synthase